MDTTRKPVNMAMIGFENNDINGWELVEGLMGGGFEIEYVRLIKYEEDNFNIKNSLLEGLPWLPLKRQIVDLERKIVNRERKLKDYEILEDRWKEKFAAQENLLADYVDKIKELEDTKLQEEYIDIVKILKENPSNNDIFNLINQILYDKISAQYMITALKSELSLAAGKLAASDEKIRECREIISAQSLEMSKQLASLLEYEKIDEMQAERINSQIDTIRELSWKRKKIDLSKEIHELEEICKIIGGEYSLRNANFESKRRIKSVIERLKNYE